MIMAILSFPIIIGILLMAVQITKNCIDGMEESSLVLYLVAMVALYGTAKIINIHIVMVQWTLVGAQHRLCRWWWRDRPRGR